MIINMLTEKDYCDYDTCVALREVGCRIQTEWYIHQPSYEKGSCYLCFGIPQETSVLDECDYIPRFSLYEAQKWLREEKGIGITIFHNYYCDTREMYYQVELYNTKHHLKTFGEFSDWTQAIAEGIKEAVKILKEE